MLKIVEQSRDEKIAMYMRDSKRSLAEMLVNCNETLVACSPSTLVWANECDAHWFTKSLKG